MAKGKKSSIRVDFSDVESRVLLPEDDYKAKPVEASVETGGDSGKKYIAWTFEILDGKYKGQKPKPFNTTLQPQGLWNLKGLLEALGVEIPDGAADIDLKEIIDNEPECVITIEHDTYENRKQANIVSIVSIDNWEGGSEEETQEVTEDDILAMDEDELEKFVEEQDLDIDLDDHKKLKAKRKAVVEAWEAKKEGGEEGGGDDDLPDEDAIGEMDEDDLEECVKEHKLDVDLGDFSTLKKKRKAVIEAIEAKKEGGEGDGEKVTEEAIMEMGKSDLKEFVDEHKLDVDLEGSTSKQRRAVVKAAKAADLIEEE